MNREISLPDPRRHASEAASRALGRVHAACQQPDAGEVGVEKLTQGGALHLG